MSKKNLIFADEATNVRREVDVIALSKIARTGPHIQVKYANIASPAHITNGEDLDDAPFIAVYEYRGQFHVFVGRKLLMSNYEKFVNSGNCNSQKDIGEFTVTAHLITKHLLKKCEPGGAPEPEHRSYEPRQRNYNDGGRGNGRYYHNFD